MKQRILQSCILAVNHGTRAQTRVMVMVGADPEKTQKDTQSKYYKFFLLTPFSGFYKGNHRQN
jgi:hypothetical protein